jgi:hypothetical protein
VKNQNKIEASGFTSIFIGVLAFVMTSGLATTDISFLLLMIPTAAIFIVGCVLCFKDASSWSENDLRKSYGPRGMTLIILGIILCVGAILGAIFINPWLVITALITLGMSFGTGFYYHSMRLREV